VGVVVFEVQGVFGGLGRKEPACVPAYCDITIHSYAGILNGQIKH
jgi:hypothetical protein